MLDKLYPNNSCANWPVVTGWQQASWLQAGHMVGGALSQLLHSAPHTSANTGLKAFKLHFISFLFTAIQTNFSHCINCKCDISNFVVAIYTLCKCDISNFVVAVYTLIAITDFTKASLTLALSNWLYCTDPIYWHHLFNTPLTLIKKKTVIIIITPHQKTTHLEKPQSSPSS